MSLHVTPALLSQNSFFFSQRQTELVKTNCGSSHPKTHHPPQVPSLRDGREGYPSAGWNSQGPVSVGDVLVMTTYENHISNCCDYIFPTYINIYIYCFIWVNFLHLLQFWPIYLSRFDVCQDVLNMFWSCCCMIFVHFITQMTRCCGEETFKDVWGFPASQEVNNQWNKRRLLQVTERWRVPFLSLFHVNPSLSCGPWPFKKSAGLPQYPPITSDQLRDLSWKMCSKWVAPIIGSHSPPFEPSPGLGDGCGQYPWAMGGSQCHQGWWGVATVEWDVWKCRNWMELGDLPCRAGIG